MVGGVWGNEIGGSMSWTDGIDPEVLKEANEKAKLEWRYRQREPELKCQLHLNFFQKFLDCIGLKKIVENQLIKKMNRRDKEGKRII